MKRVKGAGKYTLLIALLVLGVASAITVPAPAAAAGGKLKMVQIEVDSPGQVKKLARMGLDIAAVRRAALSPWAGDFDVPGFRVQAVVSTHDERKLQRHGFNWRQLQRRQTRNTLRPMTTAAPVADTVYHSFDEPKLGIRDQLYDLAADHRHLISLQTIGYSHQKRPLLMVCVSAGQGKHKYGEQDKKRHQRKPEVLFVATHHAREWVATQMGIRLIKYLVANYGTDKRVSRLLETTRIYIMPVANPDGYEYTFTDERLWRKNLRDNDGDGEITLNDGVDLNRNFDSHWALDDEGSSPSFSDNTYRGPEPNSEPETKALVKFIQRHKFKFIISYHTYSDLILYPWGWQVQTPCHDDPIFVAQAGTDEAPAIWDTILDRGYDPGVGADLYTTNGDFTDWAYARAGVPSHTVEFTYGEDADGNFYGFEFPDDEAMVQQVFEDSLNFALSVCESAADPANPVSPTGLVTEAAYHTPVGTSHGVQQGVEVLARNHSRLKLLYQIDEGRRQIDEGRRQIDKGRWRQARFREMLGNTYNQKPGVYYTRYRATIRGQRDGARVRYKIVGKDIKLGPYEYQVDQAGKGNVLILAAEDYSGDYPVYADTSGPNYLKYYTDALDELGVAYNIWDVDEKATAPSYTEVLSHYDKVIWYTGDDYAPTVPGFGVHEDEALSVRAYLNYSDGKLFATGQDLAYLSSVYGMFSDDFFQYYLGAFMHVDGAGMDSAMDQPFDVTGVTGDPVFDGLDFKLTGADSAGNQTSADSFLATSYFLPHFESAVAARYVRPGGPFDPHSGMYYVYSQMSDRSFKRLGGVFTVPEDDPVLTFRISYDIEVNWDFAFVEIADTATGTWTTLPDDNALTVSTTGDSCASGWVEQIHPHLAHYMDDACTPVGSTGEWYAFTGNSNGWQQVRMDLSAWRGREVELYISYASDWGTQNLGVFLDDVQLGGEVLQDFETGLDPWQVSVAPGSTAINNWTRIEGAGFPEGPAIRTDNAVYLGFGFEAIASDTTRATVMKRVLDYLD